MYLVGIQLAEHIRGDGQQTLAVINIAGRDLDDQEFALMVDDGMELEAAEPAGGGFTAQRPGRPCGA